jgi:hypothetical protein
MTFNFFIFFFFFFFFWLSFVFFCFLCGDILTLRCELLEQLESARQIDGSRAFSKKEEERCEGRKGKNNEAEKRSEDEQKQKKGESEVRPHFIFVVCVPPPFLPPASTNPSLH